ncbi:MAG TPA: type II toxin-antitoxin system VapC family toxin [Acidimicrobiales bacterium]|jgi:predicted nucleic acid-binding protein|nr:type II toxin-antitoxin system VapC family toxin [Acidimicrobiales bacterium]
MADVVVDASAMVDVLLGGPLGDAVADRLSGHGLHGPAHLDAECLSVLGRLSRAGHVPPATVERQLDLLAAAPIERHPVADLLRGAWSRRGDLRLADAVYVELAESLGLPLVTTDGRLKAVRVTDVVALGG